MQVYPQMTQMDADVFLVECKSMALFGLQWRFIANSARLQCPLFVLDLRPSASSADKF
jgi:hypothetical protein